MSELIKKSEEGSTMTSLELVDQINNARKEVSEKMNTKYVVYKHNDMIKKIREEMAIEEEMGAGGNISSGSYLDKNNQERLMFTLPLSRAKMLVAAQVPAVRIMVAKYIETLEAAVATPKLSMAEMQLLVIGDLNDQVANQKKLIEGQCNQIVTLGIENKAQTEEITAMKPKADMFDSYMKDNNDIETPSNVGMILEQMGMPVSPHRMYTWLKDHGYCKKTGGDWIPTYKARHQKLMVVMDIQRPSTSEGTKTRKQGYVTRKGLSKFYDIMCQEKLSDELKSGQTSLFNS